MTRAPSITLLYHESSLRHSAGPGHSESPTRVKTLLHWAKTKNVPTETVRAATQEEILSIHDKELYRLVELTQKKPIAFTGDTLSNEHTFEAALHSAGAAIEATSRSTRDQQFFSIARPPGHHANHGRVMGFCYFNSIAIGVKQLLEKDPAVKRIAILDHDNHFGNGTYEIFEEEPNILYISLHADPRWCFPGWGHLMDIGRGAGEGFNVCIPMPPRATGADYQLAFEQIVSPIIHQYKPDAMVCSVGFDAYYKDPIGILGLTEDGFRFLGLKIVQELAMELGVPVSHILEGGYNIKALPGLMDAYLTPYLDPDVQVPAFEKSPKEKETTAVLDQLRDILSSFWNLT